MPKMEKRESELFAVGCPIEYSNLITLLSESIATTK